MNGKYLLDTNIVIALFAEDDSIQDRVNQAEEIFIPCIVIGELYYGAYKSKNTKANLKKLGDFSAENVVLGIDMVTAKLYAEIKIKLQKIGITIPENDVWISAIAQVNQLILVSRDEHFKEIKELKFGKLFLI